MFWVKTLFHCKQQYDDAEITSGTEGNEDNIDAETVHFFGGVYVCKISRENGYSYEAIMTRFIVD